MGKVIPFIMLSFLLLSCGHPRLREKDREIALSRKLEQAIELGDKYLAESELIDNVARTEGVNSAVKLSDELQHHAKLDAFWNSLQEADGLWRTIPDTAEQRAVLSRLRPYIDHLITITGQINK